jgi:hypothetical protein
MNLMKFLRNVAIALSILTYTQSAAQEIPEPDFSQKPYYIKEEKLSEFEKVDATLERKVKGMGNGGVEFYYSVPDLKSSARFAASAVPKIIIKTEDNSDPTEAILVCVGEAKKDNRRFKSFKMGTFGGTKGISDNRIKIAVKKIRDKVFEITIDQVLPAGEYAILPYSKDATAMAMTAGVKVSCFGVD